MRKIRTTVIGCGKVGATHALAYLNIENAELATVCDISQEHASALAEKYNGTYADVEKMIRENDVEAVSVCTPHPLHAEFICRAAAMGICHQ